MAEDLFAGALGAAYSAYMERPGLSRVIGGLVWGGDTRDYYASMAAVGEVPAGGTVVDCPCGAGPALRALRPGVGVRYVAADLSPAMLRRARERAAARGLDEIEFLQADATALPLSDGSADLFLSYWGLHCFTNPRAAVAEAGRVLKPGGRLVGTCFLRGRDSLRQRLLIRPEVGAFGRVPTQPEVERWLEEAGLELADARRSGPYLLFQASAPDQVG
jgi:ubiquinone/menaquinone biosynthesis C-methylase UbiE